MNGKTQYGSSPLPNLATRGRGLADAGTSTHPTSARRTFGPGPSPTTALTLPPTPTPSTVTSCTTGVSIRRRLGRKDGRDELYLRMHLDDGSRPRRGRMLSARAEGRLSPMPNRRATRMKIKVLKVTSIKVGTQGVVVRPHQVIAVPDSLGRRLIEHAPDCLRKVGPNSKR
jgi:hypothetical protein